jgi:osmotically-inducible protein OsmY
MPVWRLSPVDLNDPNWEASSHRGAIVVRALNEESAREVAQSAFGVKTRFKHRGPLTSPWKRGELVRAERISGEGFDPKGPSAVLAPSFDSDLAAGSAKPGRPSVREWKNGAGLRQPKAIGARPASHEKLALLAKIRTALRSDLRLGAQFELSALQIERDGVVTLTGELPSVACKKLTLECVAALPGVSGIADRLRVKAATPMGDREIQIHLRDMLIGEPAFNELEIQEIDGGKYRLLRGAPLKARGNICLEAVDGVVKLNGLVPDLVTKRLAGVMAWWVPGTRDVVNGLALDPPEADSPDQIAEAVRLVLEKDPFVNAGQIRAGVRNTTVRLTGYVPNATEREAAERDAWCIFAVDDVINEIQVHA